MQVCKEEGRESDGDGACWGRSVGVQGGTERDRYAWICSERRGERGRAPKQERKGESVGVGKGGGHMGSAMVCMTSSLDLEIDVLASQTHGPGVG